MLSAPSPSVADLCTNELDCLVAAANKIVSDPSTASHSATSSVSESLKTLKRKMIQRHQQLTSQDSVRSCAQHLREGPANPYHVLQIRRDATPSEIRQAYRRLALWHHPGRSHDCVEERQRRLQVFELISACYETLMSNDSRQALDALVREMELQRITAGLPTGAMYIGGVRVETPQSRVTSPVNLSLQHHRSDTIISFGSLTTSHTARSLFTMGEDDDRAADDSSGRGPDRLAPPLSRLSSQSSGSNDSDDELILSCANPRSVQSHTNRIETPQPILAKSSSSSSEAERHFTAADTSRLFGGPFSLLYRARDWKAFTDPFELFVQVFGSAIFPKPEIGRLPQWKPLRTTRSAAWTGSSHVDGSETVYTTTRVLHDRKLTRTETMFIDPKSGETKSIVTVTAEELDPSISLNDDMDGFRMNCKWNDSTPTDCVSCSTCDSSSAFTDWYTDLTQSFAKKEKKQQDWATLSASSSSSST